MSSGSSIAPDDAIGNSVRPQLDNTPRPPSTSWTSRWSSGELGAPPCTPARRFGNSGSAPWARCAAMYAWKNGSAEPRIVARFSAMTSGLRCASNASINTMRCPTRSAAASNDMPPMCVIGNGIGTTSSGVGWTPMIQPDEPASTDASLCHTPLGSDVEPDVWYSHRAGSSSPSANVRGGGNVAGSPTGSARSPEPRPSWSQVSSSKPCSFAIGASIPE